MRWVLLFIALVAADPRWAAWELRRTSTQDDVYIDMAIGGQPPQMARMLLDFTRPRSTLWNSRMTHSQSPTSVYVNETVRRDWTRMGSAIYALEYHAETDYAQLYSSNLYYDADGRLGLARSSELWQLWTGFVMSYGTFVLYKGDPPKSRSIAGAALECLRHDAAPLCSVRFGSNERVDLFSNGSTTWLSADAYDALFRRYNVYSSAREAPPVDLAGGALSIGANEYVLDRTDVRQRRLLVGRDDRLDGGASRIGTAIVRGYDVEVDVFRGRLYVQRSAQTPHLTSWQLALELALTMLFSVWFLVPLSSMTTLETGKPARVSLQLASLALFLVAYLVSGDPFAADKLDGSVVSFGVWLGLNVAAWYFLAASISVVYVDNVVLDEDERAFSHRTYVQLGKALVEDALLHGMWLVLHLSSAVILSVYAAFLVSLFMAAHSAMVAFLMLYYASSSRLPTPLRWHYWLLVGGQVIYTAWNFGFVVWNELNELLLVASPEFLYLVPYISVPLELFVAKLAASVAHQVAHNRHDPNELIFL